VVHENRCQNASTDCGFPNSNSSFPKLPFAANELPDSADMLTYDVMTVPANLVGVPAISVPFGHCGGRPVGMQLMGERGGDARILETALALEQRS